MWNYLLFIICVSLNRTYFFYENLVRHARASYNFVRTYAYPKYAHCLLDMHNNHPVSLQDLKTHVVVGAIYSRNTLDNRLTHTNDVRRSHLSLPFEKRWSQVACVHRQRINWKHHKYTYMYVFCLLCVWNTLPIFFFRKLVD